MTAILIQNDNQAIRLNSTLSFDETDIDQFLKNHFMNTVFIVIWLAFLSKLADEVNN